ncbi:MAG: Flp pilus assembly complex ATPase component TadA [Phycisphaeraceae bacterium]|nr:Flp pilus assembly complex ATPase component TadA [Phycisphaerae bacterium]MBX3393615.1 Flp pilus assembly complex ATPase component TadA [Phycisphaeraceae bacterium]HRJ49609.1 ATPase, T2SS/T4P/T4SS family [Phycisphaerales bacterium]
MSLILKTIRGDTSGTRIGRDAVSIGRGLENTICLRDDRASRAHCVIEPDGRGGYVVRDLNSRNGTKVNDRKISVAPLRPGDVLRIGSHEFLVEPDESIPQGGPSIDAGTAAWQAEENVDFGGLAQIEVESGQQAESMPTPQAFPEVSSERPASEPVEWASRLDELIDELPPRDSPRESVSIVDAAGKPSLALDGSSLGSAGMSLLLKLASKARATDIHIEPKGDRSQVRMRVDGQMITTVDLPARVGELVYGLIKTASQIKMAARDAVQEGHFSARFPDRRVDYRVSFTPSVYGQKLVLRVLDTRGLPRSINELGLVPYMVDRVRRICEQDHGLLLVCGPTGSGKTTTLYTCIREIDRHSRNVVTIEDPVEYQLDMVTQIPIDDHKGNSFGALLRSVLRQDPDVILVGEIRDEETARTAMQAAMTGHVVFSSIHAKDTIAAVFRLLELKVESYLVANSLDLILAQRLVRVLCETCRREVAVTPGQSTRLGKYLSNKTRVFSATGCPRCLRTGYRGRRAIFEMLDFNDDLRDVVLREPTIQAMKRVIEQGHFTTLVQFGWRLVAEGVTTLDEVDHVAGVQ